MGRTACTESQYLYKGCTLPLLLLPSSNNNQYYCMNGFLTAMCTEIWHAVPQKHTNTAHESPACTIWVLSCWWLKFRHDDHNDCDKYFLHLSSVLKLTWLLRHQCDLQQSQVHVTSHGHMNFKIPVFDTCMRVANSRGLCVTPVTCSS
jgi:hypothetical protein